MERNNKNIAEYIKHLWNQSYTKADPRDAERSWQEFSGKVFTDNKSKVRRLQIFYYAAAAIVLFIAINKFVVNPNVNYLVVENPGTAFKQIKLPDNSVVAIQPGSKLYYAENFSENRSVKLEGEGYFQVVKNKERPFTVACYKTLTTVLGTSFNIKSDTENNVEIALYEGSIKATVEGMKDNWLLTPGEQLVYNNQKGISIEAFNNFFNPLETNFDIENASIKEVIAYVKQIYGYDLVIDTSYYNRSLTMRISKYDSLQNVINVISTIYKLKAEINEDMKQITLSK